VGPSGSPSCTPAIQVAEAGCTTWFDEGGEGKRPAWDFRYEVSVAKDGTLSIGPDKFPLSFP
jgi:hypothetical protein